MALAVVAALCLALLTWTFYTETGSRLALSLAERWTPQPLSWENASGELAGPLTLYGVEWHTQTEQVRLERLIVDWHPWQIFGRKLHLDSLQVEGASVTLVSRDSTHTATDSLDGQPNDTLPFSFPLDLQVDELAVTDAVVSMDSVFDASSLTVHGRGTPDDYTIAVSTNVTAVDFNPIAMSVTARGGRTSIQFDSVVAVTSNEERVYLTGEASWQPTLQWDLVLTARHLDPSGLSANWSEWSGRLSAQAHTSGTWDELPDVDIFLDSLWGTLRGKAVIARADTHIADSGYFIDHVNLTWGSLNLMGHGTWDDSLDASFMLEAPDLGEVLPDAAGSVHVEGKASGSASQPGIKATLAAHQVVFGSYQLESLRGDIHTPQGGMATSRVILTAHGLSLPDVQVTSCDLIVSGTRNQNEFHADLSSPQGTLTVGGQSQLADSVWQGQLDILQLKGDWTGHWDLTRPVDFSVAPERTTWSPLCLQSDSGSLCVAGDFARDSWSLDVQMDSLALSLLQALQPGEWAASGRVSGKAKVQSNLSGVLTGTVVVPPATCWLASSQDTLILDPFSMSLTLEPDSAIGLLSVAYASSQSQDRAGIETEFSMAGFGGIHLDTMPNPLSLLQLPWSLDAHLTSVSLDHVQRWLPAGLELDDPLNGHLAFQSKPNEGLTGTATLNLPSGSVPVPAGADTVLLMFDSSAIDIHAGGDSIKALLNLAFAPRGAAGRATFNAALTMRDFDAELATSSWRFEEALERLPWSVQLQIDGVAPDHLQGLLPTGLQFDDPLHVQLDVHSLGEQGMNGWAEVLLPAGSYTLTGADKPAALYWQTVASRLDMDSTGLKATLQSALKLEDEQSVGHIEAKAFLPSVRSIEDLQQHQKLQMSVDAQLDLSVLSLVSTSLSHTTGELTVDVDASGSTDQVQLLGSIDLSGRTELPEIGLALEEISLRAEGHPDGIEYSGSARSGNGILTIGGHASRIPSEASPTTLEIEGSNFQVLATPQYQVTISPTLKAVSTGTRLDITGDVFIPAAIIEQMELPESAVAVSKDVVFVGPDARKDTVQSLVTARVNVRLGDEVFFKGLGFSSFLDGQIEVVDKPGATTQGRGELQFRQGKYRGYGQEFDVDPGRLIFTSDIDNPGLDVLAWRLASDNTRAGFKVTGTAQNPVINTYSEPVRSREDVMSYILFGRPLNQGSESDQMRASQAAAFMGSNILAMQAATKVGLDDARIEPGTKRNDAAFFAGKYLSPKLYVAYGTGIYETINTLRVRYILSKNWTLQAETGTRETADIVYQIER
jgi:autotransporter translocation and assembly factor TamB